MEEPWKTMQSCMNLLNDLNVEGAHPNIQKLMSRLGGQLTFYKKMQLIAQGETPVREEPKVIEIPTATNPKTIAKQLANKKEHGQLRAIHRVGFDDKDYEDIRQCLIRGEGKVLHRKAQFVEQVELVHNGKTVVVVWVPADKKVVTLWKKNGTS